jgi:uncharacterized membrane-anchored protein YitT (DUF2179 family)
MKINVFRLLNDRAQMICTLLGKLSLSGWLTPLPTKGAYAGQQKEVVYRVVQRQETRRLKQIVRNIDPRAFIVINEVYDVLREGFKEE